MEVSMKTNFNTEIYEQAMRAKNEMELYTLASKYNIPLTREQARDYFERINQKSGELADDELDNVAGGGCNETKNNADGLKQILEFLKEDNER
jgi:hypothetical protein